MATKKRVIVAKMDAEEYLKACFDVAARRYSFVYKLEVLDVDTVNPLFVVGTSFQRGRGRAPVSYTYSISTRVLQECIEQGISTLDRVLGWAALKRVRIG